MAPQSAHQLFLLADHLKLSLLERQRAVTLNLDASKQDGQISRSLNALQEGVEALESQQTDPLSSNDPTSDVARLRSQFRDIYSQFHGAAPASTEITRPNDPALESDFVAAQGRPPQTSQSKSVRFRDNPSESEPEFRDDPATDANRAALFSETGRYRDELEPPNQDGLDNQQIHTYHKQVLRDQDEQLDTLSQSVGRQRMIGIQMGNELDEQNELLEDVESGVDRHTTTLGRARKRLGHVARKSRDNWSWVTIGILIVILLLLIVVLK